MNIVSKLLAKLGPGILFAGAAIGASHLVQSTRAGAEYGFSLLIVVILANLLKYPFFEYGQRYSAATGESIIKGYSRIARPVPYLFLLLNILTSVISAAGVTIVTAAILKFILVGVLGIGSDISLTFLSLVTVTIISLILIKGSYSLLDKSVKYIIVSLSVFTVIAFITSLVSIEAANWQSIQDSFTPLSGEISFGFLIALIGWMPAPVEASSWSSLWAVEKSKSEKINISLKDTLFDFKVGYITTTILACIFLGLGAMVIYPTGQEISSGAVGFVQQLINVYTSNLGDWALPVISFVALATMVSTTLTVIDAYPRALEETVRVISNKKEITVSYNLLVIVVSIIATAIIWLFNNRLTDLIDFVTTVSFIAAPVFGLMNIMAMRLDIIDIVYRPNTILKFISYLGVFFASGLAIWYFLQ